jgi:hypothetical protein
MSRKIIKEKTVAGILMHSKTPNYVAFVKSVRINEFYQHFQRQKNHAVGWSS